MAIETITVKFDKKDIPSILSESESINVDVMADEIMKWLDINVENFIDNHAKLFKIPLDTLDLPNQKCSVAEIKKLQDLYRAIPDDDTVDSDKIQGLVDCRKKLDIITSKVYDAIQNKKDLLKILYDRMSFYYELKGVKDGKPIIQEYEGFVSVNNFEYEAFSVGVKVSGGFDVQNQNGEILKVGEKENVKEYVIPEGFVIWVEIGLKPKVKPVSLF